ncbi:MAG: hypothetical protein ACRDLN_11510, partial [Solirubrobacteraceae bacterium]
VPPEDYDRFHTRANDIGLAFAQAITPEQLPAVDAAITALAAGRDPRSPLALEVGAKGYHDEPRGIYTRAGAATTATRSRVDSG